MELCGLAGDDTEVGVKRKRLARSALSKTPKTHSLKGCFKSLTLKTPIISPEWCQNVDSNLNDLISLQISRDVNSQLVRFPHVSVLFFILLKDQKLQK